MELVSIGIGLGGTELWPVIRDHDVKAEPFGKVCNGLANMPAADYDNNRGWQNGFHEHLHLTSTNPGVSPGGVSHLIG
jgi:hypothetical protein